MILFSSVSETSGAYSDRFTIRRLGGKSNGSCGKSNGSDHEFDGSMHESNAGAEAEISIEKRY